MTTTPFKINDQVTLRKVGTQDGSTRIGMVIGVDQTVSVKMAGEVIQFDKVEGAIAEDKKGNQFRLVGHYLESTED